MQPMSAPVSGADTRPLTLGDTRDDDGAVIDSFFVETDAPPALVIEPIDTAPLHKPKPATVLRTGTYELATGWTAIKLLVADPNRNTFRLRGYSLAAAPSATDYALVAFDPGLLTPQAAFRLRHNTSLDLDEHTGDVYVLLNSAATGAYELTYAAVTK